MHPYYILQSHIALTPFTHSLPQYLCQFILFSATAKNKKNGSNGESDIMEMGLGNEVGVLQQEQLQQDLVIKITTMKMMFHIDDFKCTLCANWFCPPFNLPYLLPCTHSICTSCLQKASSHDHIICPEDLESCPIQSININQTTKKALERLMKQHKNYNQNTQLQCIKSLSIGFDEVLGSKQKQLRNLQALIDQIFHSEIERLRHLHQKIKIDLNRPYRIVEDWKEIVATHLTNIRKIHHNSTPDARSNSMLQLNHYIQQGRKIKMDLNQFFQLQFDIFADRLMRSPRSCFEKDFTISTETLDTKLKPKSSGESGLKNQILTEKNEKREREKRQIISQVRQKIQTFQPIQTSTIVISSQNKRCQNPRQSLKPLCNVDMNRNYNVQTSSHDSVGIETKRGHNKQKSGHFKTVEIQNNENTIFGKYISDDNQKNSSKNQRKDSQQKKKKVQAASPLKIQKTAELKNRQQPRLSSRQDCKNSFNDNSVQNKHEQFSLSQFQLETLQGESQSQVKDRSKFTKQVTPAIQNIHNMQTVQYTQNSCLEKQSPISNNSKYHSNEQDRMNRLANMLENISSQNSNRNSLKKSRKNISRRGSQLQQTSGQNSLLMSPNTICEKYTQQAQSQVPYEQEQLLNNQEMLMNDDKDNGWEMGNVNFLREWKLKNQNNLEQPLEVRQNTYYYNCQKQKLSYMRKMQIHRVQEALKLTIMKDNFIELINESLHDVDMTLYLEQFDWKHSNIEIVKFVKTSMTDQQLNILLNFLIKSHVKALVLSGNNLTDICLDALLNFVTLNNVLKNVYLPKNYINIMKSKTKINLLKQKGVNIYV